MVRKATCDCHKPRLAVTKRWLTVTKRWVAKATFGGNCHIPWFSVLQTRTARTERRWRTNSSTYGVALFPLWRKMSATTPTATKHVYTEKDETNVSPYAVQTRQALDWWQAGFSLSRFPGRQRLRVSLLCGTCPSSVI